MDIETQSASPAQLYEQATRHFVAGDFKNARSWAHEVDALATEQAKVANCDSVESPLYSTIIVTHRDIEDFGEALSRLSPYSRDSKYEIIVVDNGNPAASDLASRSFDHYTFVNVGFNYGCSGARNIGARTARGEFLIFVDDDGLIEDGAIESLVEVIEDRKAVMVRGRVLAKSRSGTSAPHYDLGDDIISAGPNAECLLICRRDEFLKHGGFDTLLAGHEGWALCAKMYPFHGSQSFLYAPDAKIRHDYATGPEHEAEKRVKFRLNDSYIAEYYPHVFGLRLCLDNPEVAAAKRLHEQVGEIRELKRRAGYFERALARAERARDEIRMSRSWWITAPMRKIARVLRRIKKSPGRSSPQ